MASHSPSVRDNYLLNVPGTVTSGSGVSVSTLTPLTSWVSVVNFVKVLFALQNTDVMNEVSLIVETSEDGATPDAVFWRATAPAGEQVSYEVGPKDVHQFFRMSAVTDSPGFPTVSVNWQMRGIPRA